MDKFLNSRRDRKASLRKPLFQWVGSLPGVLPALMPLQEEAQYLHCLPFEQVVERSLWAIARAVDIRKL